MTNAWGDGWGDAWGDSWGSSATISATADGQTIVVLVSIIGGIATGNFIEFHGGVGPPPLRINARAEGDILEINASIIPGRVLAFNPGRASAWRDSITDDELAMIFAEAA